MSVIILASLLVFSDVGLPSLFVAALQYFYFSSSLVGWLVVLRINVDLAIFQPYLDLEAGDNQSLKIQVARPGIEPRSSCSASQELNITATAAPSSSNMHIFIHSLHILVYTCQLGDNVLLALTFRLRVVLQGYLLFVDHFNKINPTRENYYLARANLHPS